MHLSYLTKYGLVSSIVVDTFIWRIIAPEYSLEK